MLRVVNSIITVLYIAASLITPIQANAEDIVEPALVPTLIITEAKVWYDSTKGSATPLVTEDDDYNEFVEFYNPTMAPISLADFSLEYKNSTGSVLVVQAISDGILGPGQFFTLVRDPSKGGKIVDHAGALTLSASGLVNSNGRLRLLYKGEQVADESFAWGSIGASSQTLSFNRAQNQDSSYTLFDPTWVVGDPSPKSSEVVVQYAGPEEDQEDDAEVDESEEIPEATPLTCEGIIISELLANPTGSDADGEFIELYNPTNEIINLAGCSLQTSAASKQFSLPGITLEPGAYSVFGAAVSGLTLPNSAGGTAWLLSLTEEIDEVMYPANLEDDASWSLIDTEWQVSYAPTPGQSNLSMSLKPCPEGQVRNLDGNKCQASIVTAAATLTPCKPGQERNPETNRCRTVAGIASTTLVPCKPGQERNPDTNRCRNVLAASTLAECDPGQERNPETNRCRKTLASADGKLASVEDVKSPVKPTSPPWLLIATAVLMAIGYAVYEWRQEIRLQVQKVTTRFSK